MLNNGKLSMKKFWKFFLIDATFEGGRMFVGAVSIVYLLSMGVSLQQIAILKMVQGLVLFFGEVPTGVFADTLGRSRSLIVACMCAAIGFLLYIISSSFYFFMLAEVFTALSLCFWSGAYEAFCIDSCDLKGGEIYQFFSIGGVVGGFFVLLAGLLGAVVGDYGLAIPYVLGIASFVAATALIKSAHRQTTDVRVPLTTISQMAEQFNKHFHSAFQEGIMQSQLIPLFLVGIASQFLIQPILHYWQPLFQKVDITLASHDTGLVFFAYCLSSMVFKYIYAKLSSREMFRSPLAILVIYTITSLLYFSVSMYHEYLGLLILFSLMQGVMAVGGISVAARLNEKIGSQSRASILSSFSMFSRIGMIISLFVIPIVMRPQPMNEQIESLFTTYSHIALWLCGASAIFISYKWFSVKHQKSVLVQYK